MSKVKVYELAKELGKDSKDSCEVPGRKEYRSKESYEHDFRG